MASYQQGRQDERARIVKWLNWRADTFCGDGTIPDIAEGISQGDHWAEPPNGMDLLADIDRVIEQYGACRVIPITGMGRRGAILVPMDLPVTEDNLFDLIRSWAKDGIDKAVVAFGSKST